VAAGLMFLLTRASARVRLALGSTRCGKVESQKEMRGVSRRSSSPRTQTLFIPREQRARIKRV